MNDIKINNNLIAQFMDFESVEGKPHKLNAPKNYEYLCDSTYKGKYIVDFEHLNFNASWDWLMPVVEKIKDFLSKAEHVYNIAPEEQTFDFQLYKESGLHISHLTIFASRGTVYDAVVEFIKWYNKQLL